MIHMNADANAIDPRTEPHEYVGWPGMKWRTCQCCGRGANAKIHRAER